MRVLEINAVPYGSTAKIMLGIADVAKQDSGIQIYTSSGYSTHPIKNLPKKYFQIGSIISKSAHKIASTVTGFDGCFSYFTTKKFIGKIKKLKIDILHLHNLHCYYINLPLLFKYIKKYNVPVVWTLHDCWAFTGHCPHFTIEKCEKWKEHCFKCPQYRKYPKSLFDNSKKMFRLKKKWFTGVKNLTIVTPSQWLADLVKQSFLKDYPIKVIHNGIDLTVFKPTPSDFRKKYGIPENKFILLGGAFGWGARKGLDVFIELAHRLDKEKFQIVLVGTDNNVDKQLPKEIISIHRTQNQAELAEIYSAADLFVNPTREENYPTVNMEAIACGTPVVTFRTGGSPECISEKTGSVTGYNDIDALQKEIERICETKPFSKEDCITRAKEFDENVRFKEYLELYKEAGN